MFLTLTLPLNRHRVRTRSRCSEASSGSPEARRARQRLSTRCASSAASRFSARAWPPHETLSHALVHKHYPKNRPTFQALRSSAASRFSARARQRTASMLHHSPTSVARKVGSTRTVSLALRQARRAMRAARAAETLIFDTQQGRTVCLGRLLALLGARRALHARAAARPHLPPQ